MILNENSTRAGVIALLGAPNAGKSTLTNALVGQKVAITSPKVQTTRVRLTGIATVGRSQLLLVDTPGLFQPRRRLERAMVESALGGASDADILLVLVDARAGLRPDVRDAFAKIAHGKAPKWLVLNKIDKTEKESLLALAAEANTLLPFAETFMVSALTGDGVDTLRDALANAVPEGPWLFPEDQLSNAPTRIMAAELIREQLFRQLGQELPYETAVQIEQFKEQSKGVVVHASILVQRDSQKPIVIGRGGQRIKAIGQLARQELEEMLGTRAHLFLNVKVERDWTNRRSIWRDIGLDWVE